MVMFSSESAEMRIKLMINTLVGECWLSRASPLGCCQYQDRHECHGLVCGECDISSGNASKLSDDGCFPAQFAALALKRYMTYLD